MWETKGVLRTPLKPTGMRRGAAPSRQWKARRPKGSLLEGAAAARRLREWEARLPLASVSSAAYQCKLPPSALPRCWNTAIPRQRYALLEYGNPPACFTGRCQGKAIPRHGLRRATPFQKGAFGRGEFQRVPNTAILRQRSRAATSFQKGGFWGRSPQRFPYMDAARKRTNQKAPL